MVDCIRTQKWLKHTNTVETTCYDRVSGDVIDCSECQKCLGESTCWKDKFIEGGLDNTFTSFRHTSQSYTVTFDNGDVDTFAFPDADDWTDQVQKMAAGLGSIMPWAQTVDPFCNLPNGCGGLSGPVVELNQMFARYVGFRVCPGDKVPVVIEYTSDQRTDPVKLVVQYVETDTIYIDRCVNCGDSPEWFVDGEPYTPVCAIPCGDEFPEIPLAQCATDYSDGCDNVGGTDVSQFVNIVRAVTDCGDGPEVIYLVEEDGGLSVYELVGDFVDCATGEIIPEPATECECCPVPTGDCRCYGSDESSSSDYTYVNSDNETDGSFSMNTTTIKWDTTGGDGSLDGSIPYIDDCISSGGIATITILDGEDNTIIFTADAFINAPGTAPATAYSGTGPGGFSGKIKEVTISCSTNTDNTSGKACSFIDCNNIVKWKDSKTGIELTEEQCETLFECPLPINIQPECPEELISFVSCAAESTDEVETEDQILTVARQDCNGVILSSTQYDISQSVTANIIPSAANNVVFNGTDTWTYSSVANEGGIVYDLQIQRITNVGLQGFVPSANANVNVSGNPRQSPYGILEYTLLDQSTGLPVTVDKFTVVQSDIDGQSFGGNNSNNMYEIIGFETGEFDNITLAPTLSFNNFIGPQAGNRNTQTAAYTKIRQPSNPRNTVGRNVTVEYSDVQSFRVLYAFTAQQNWANSTSRNFFFGSMTAELPTDIIELEQPVSTTECDPQPEVETLRQCLVDADGTVWTQLVVVDPALEDEDLSPLFINNETLEIGEPSGSSSDWVSCAEGEKYPKTVCHIDSGTPIGIVGKRWDSELNASAFDTNTNTFTAWNTHVNGTPDEEVVIVNNWSLNDLDFPLTGQSIGGGVDPDVSSQELYYAWINVTETILLRDNNGNTGEYISIFLEDCNKDMVQIVKDKYTTSTDPNAGVFATICPGVHKIAIQINDYSVYGGFSMQYSNDDGATWIDFPIADTYSAPPKLIETCVLYHENGDITNIDGTLFTENIVPCNPPCYPLTRAVLPDTEVSIVDGCDDIDGDPANYVNVTREVIFQGGESTTTYYANYGDENAQAVYTVQGGFVDCATGEPIEEPVVPPPCNHWSIVNVYKPVGENGVNVERWNANAITGEPVSLTPSAIFVGDPDYSGMPAHDNGAPDGPIVIESDLTILDNVNDQSQFRYWTYMYITEPIRLRESHPRGEAVDYWLGECCGEPLLVATGVYPNTTNVAFDVALEPGIHYIGGTVFDFSAYSGVRYQYSTDNGANWVNVPASWLYSKKPTISQCPAKVCIETGVCADLKTGLELGSEVTLCKPSLCSGSADPVIIQCAPQTFYRVNLGEVGTVEQKWTTSAVSTSTATGHTYRDAFTGVDSDGLPAHPNTPDTTISSTIASTTNVLSNDSPIIDDQAQSDFWIYLPSDATLQEFNATAEASGVWISGKCGQGDLTEILDAPYLNSTANNLGAYESSWYKVRLYHHDVTANGVTRLQADFGDGFVNIPAYIEPPTVEVIKGWYCSDGLNYNQDKSEILDESWVCEDPRCSAVNSGSSNPEPLNLQTLKITP